MLEGTRNTGRLSRMDNSKETKIGSHWIKLTLTVLDSSIHKERYGEKKNKKVLHRRHHPFSTRHVNSTSLFGVSETGVFQTPNQPRIHSSVKRDRTIDDIISQCILRHLCVQPSLPDKSLLWDYLNKTHDSYFRLSSMGPLPSFISHLTRKLLPYNTPLHTCLRPLDVIQLHCLVSQPLCFSPSIFPHVPGPAFT